MSIRINNDLEVASASEATPETAAFTAETAEMPESFSSGPELSLILVPILFFGIFFGLCFFFARRSFKQFRAYTVLVKGTVVSKRPNERHSGSDDVEFEYMFRGMSYRAFAKWPVPRLGSKLNLPEGRIVGIRVNPDDPTDIYWGKGSVWFRTHWEDEYGNRC